MRRIVPIIVDDDRVERLRIEFCTYEDVPIEHGVYPIPLDDQLTRDLDDLTSFGMFIPASMGWSPDEVEAMKQRLRAWFKLDEEGET